MVIIDCAFWLVIEWRWGFIEFFSFCYSDTDAMNFLLGIALQPKHDATIDNDQHSPNGKKRNRRRRKGQLQSDQSTPVGAVSTNETSNEIAVARSSSESLRRDSVDTIGSSSSGFLQERLKRPRAVL
jgi:hypothetical protein